MATQLTSTHTRISPQLERLLFLFLALLLMISFSGCGQGGAVNNPEALPDEMTHPEELSTQSSAASMGIFDSQTFNEKPWTREFEIVIVVNKAAAGDGAQSIVVYQNGREVLRDRVSTGRERQETAGAGGPARSYFSATPVGYYTPYLLAQNYVSKLWGAKMPYAVFFNNGIALHEVPPSYTSKLGTRASGGCVRLAKETAPVVFDLTKASAQKSIPKFTRWGAPVLDKNAQQTYGTGYSTLVIVQDTSLSN